MKNKFYKQRILFSGFSSWFAAGLESMVGDLPVYAVSIIVTILAALFTEICSNTAATALLVPLLAELATRLCVHPIYLLLPATLACSLSFMLPGWFSVVLLLIYTFQ